MFSRSRLASGVDDSPIAKRGCDPRSIIATERPSRRATIAKSDPLNPEPTIATSKSAFTDRTTHPLPRLLSEINPPEPFLARCEASRTFGKPFQVPQIRKDATSIHADAVIDDFFKRTQTRPREFASRRECIQRAVAGSCGNNAR